jgi:D-alanyl-D-alanine dipeptidase
MLYSKRSPGKEHLTIRKEDIPIKENGEKLIGLSGISDKIKVQSMYHLQNIPGSLKECYAREGAAEKLMQAANRLSASEFFIIFDAWRPFQVQMELYNQFKKKLEGKGLSKEALKKEVSKYVDPPSADPAMPSNHLTGGAIDLTIGTESGPLNMGTGFDDFSEKSRMDAYEHLADPSETEKEIRDNRRLLKTIMEEAGFTNYEEEWWHYDYGNQSWGSLMEYTAFYGGIARLDENNRMKTNTI